MSWSLAVSTVAVAFLLFAWGGVVFAVLMKRYFGREFGHLFRPEEDFKMGGLVVEKLLQGFLLSFIYLRVLRVSDSGALNGIAFGLLLGGLLEVTYFFSTWVNYRVRSQPVLINTCFGFARMLAAGLVIGLIQG